MTPVLSLLAVIAQFQGAVILNEIMYNPDGQTLGLDEHMEWIELYNDGPETINLAGMMISDGGNQLYLGHFLLTAGAYGVICADEESFKSAYGNDVTVLPWSGEWTRLRNSSDEVILYTESGTVIESIRFEESWGASGTVPSRADGEGSSLERIDPSGPNDSTNWRPSEDFSSPASEENEDAICWGTPGLSNSVSKED